ncbi:MAG: shikimate dehydrogenase [Deltaproteobacteria bacterium]|nr:shikimate dehydrogenase [Deltaproteobacteria bacterium]
MNTPHVLGIIGNALAESLSPTLHNALLQHHGLDYVYLPFQVERRHLKNLIPCMRLTDVGGLNVTAPYKCAVIPLLDRLDRTAQQIGAVNTIVLRRGRYVGYNTDAAGFLAALQHTHRRTPRGLRVTVIGAGGTARAVTAAVLAHGAATLTLLNRTCSHATRLGREFRRHFPRANIAAQPLTPATLRAACLESDLLVQTSAAPRCGRGALLWPTRCRPAGLTLLDVRYGTGDNVFLHAARRAGVRCSDGREMLLQQAALSFHLWTGKTAALPVLRRITQGHL